MKAITNVGPGAIVSSGGKAYCVKRFESSGSILARDLTTGADLTLQLADLASSSIDDKETTREDLGEMPDEAWERACEHYQIIAPLLEAPGEVEAIRSAARTHEVSVPTLYRWMKAFRESGLVSSLVRKRRSDAGSAKIDPRAEEIISKILQERFLKSQKLKLKRTYMEVGVLCRKAGVRIPHANTFAQRVHAIAPEVKARTREGRNAALKFRAQRGSFPGADHPYAVLQIDHTPVDIILVDEIHRLPIGRPWITVAIDVFSRLVAGWYISFDPPGTLGTGMCIANAILSKEQRLAELDLAFPWPCQGLPVLIHLDNAKEFRGETLSSACQEWGIHLKFRKVKKPNYGGHIERLLGTLLTEIHALPGTTFSKPDKRENYNSEAHAAMTLKEFEQWLGNLILGIYHQRVHSVLNVTPLRRYQEGILGSEALPGIGQLPIVSDPEKLRTDLLPFERRTVQTKGIQIDNIFYYADVLQRWIGAREPGKLRKKRKFIVRCDPRNISSQLFYDPELKRYFRIPYRDVKHPPMSLWELRAVQRHLREQGKKDVDEDTIFAAFEKMLQIEESAKTSTRKARLGQERRRHHAATAPITIPEPAESPRVADAPYDLDQISAFDEIERV
ncbi:MAG: transposase [Acidobacteriaceae bacterium]